MAAIAVCLAGCSSGVAVKTPSRLTGQQVGFAFQVEHIQADPAGFLKEVQAVCDALEQYRLRFYRQERLGFLFAQLGPLEEIRASFRKTPFSVKFEWDDPKRDYFESVYVSGQNNDKLIVRERHGMFPFPPQVRIVNVTDPVRWGKAKNPITDFGLAQVVSRTLLPFEDPQVAEVMTVTYQGIVDLDPMHRPAYYLRIERPPTKDLRYTRQDFYIDVQTRYPAGTDLYLASGDLDACYRYTDVDTNIVLTDADFRLSKGHPEWEGGN